jgi:hypothetical protein
MSERESQQPPEGDLLPGFTAGGPYLMLAVLCERVLREADGVMSLIRIVDRITIQGSLDSAAPPTFPLTAVIGLKAGFARGSYLLKVKTISPAHQDLGAAELPMLFEGEDRGAVVGLTLAFQPHEEGLYWLEVYLQDVLITKMPLRVVCRRVSVTSSSGA